MILVGFYDANHRPDINYQIAACLTDTPSHVAPFVAWRKWRGHGGVIPLYHI